MKFSYRLCLIILVAFISTTVNSQEETMTAAQALNESSIETQFDMVIKKSGKYQEYKVVKREWLNKLKANTLDSIKTLETKLGVSNDKIKTQLATISNLEGSLTKTNESLTAVTEEKDSMTFLGMAFTKSSYKTMMWSIIGVLIAFLGFFIFKFKNSNAVTVAAKRALAETETEFEDHRRRALEREQKVMRKLQDEINKQRKAGAK